MPKTLQKTGNNIIFKDADQCLGTNEVKWDQLSEYDLKFSLFGLVPHGSAIPNILSSYVLYFKLNDIEDFFCSALILFNYKYIYNGLTGSTVRSLYGYNILLTKYFAESLPTTD